MAKRKKFSWSKITAKTIEQTVYKTIELSTLSLMVGLSIKYILIAVPAAVLGATIAKAIKYVMVK